jgi:hypothetical protein
VPVRTFLEDYTQRRRELETRLLLLSELPNEKPYLGPELPAHLYEIYRPFYEKLAKRAQPKQTGAGIESGGGFPQVS